jgi:hypothetical protein
MENRIISFEDAVRPPQPESIPGELKNASAYWTLLNFPMSSLVNSGYVRADVSFSAILGYN